MFKKLLSTPNDCKLTLARLAAGGVMIAHGMQKLFGWFGGAGFTASMQRYTHDRGIPAVLVFLLIIAESFGALGLILGFLARIAAFTLVVDMITAVLLVHIHVGFFMNWQGTRKGEGFEYHILMLALLIMVMIWGAGSLSVDRAIAGGKNT